MSGGSFNYAYSRIDDIGHWASIFEEMAAKCRQWAANVQTKTVKHDPVVPGQSAWTDAPLTIEDRARILVPALRFERVAKMLREAERSAKELKDEMQSVEWICSGDSGIDDLLREKP